MMQYVTKGEPGEHILDAASRAVANGADRLEFNGIMIDVPSKSPDAIVAEYEEECDARAKAWRESDAGLAYAKERASEAAAHQSKADKMISDLSGAPWPGHAAMIDWVSDVQEHFDYVGVAIDRDAIVREFSRMGYEPGVNCGAEFDGEDEDNSARWLIGQAVSGIKEVGAPHPIVREFAKRWRDKFAVAK
jgi:hypothetical protein